MWTSLLGHVSMGTEQYAEVASVVEVEVSVEVGCERGQEAMTMGSSTGLIPEWQETARAEGH